VFLALLFGSDAEVALVRYGLQVARVIYLLLCPTLTLGVCLGQDVVNLCGWGNKQLATHAQTALAQPVVAAQHVEPELVPRCTVTSGMT